MYIFRYQRSLCSCFLLKPSSSSGTPQCSQAGGGLLGFIQTICMLLEVRGRFELPVNQNLQFCAFDHSATTPCSLLLFVRVVISNVVYLNITSVLIIRLHDLSVVPELITLLRDIAGVDTLIRQCL